jgi:hypothetical protein
MLVRLSVSQWTARRFDRAVTEKAAAAYGADTSAGRYNKILIAENAIKKVSKVVNDARTFHYTNTLPWGDDGARILPAANFQQYSAEMRQHRVTFESAVAEFSTNYPDYVTEARRRLNGMFKAEDYPTESELAKKYAFDVAVDPLPDAQDFRVELQSAEIDKIRHSIETRVQAAEQAATRDLWERLHTALQHIVARLSDTDAIFRDSLIDNVKELVDLLPRLNITGDGELESKRRDVETKICGLDPDKLRTDAIARKSAASEAQAILDTMKAYTGGQ